MRAIQKAKPAPKLAIRKERGLERDSVKAQFVSLCVICCFAILAGLSSCDELVTEQIFVTTIVAENPRAEFGSDLDSGCAPLTVTFLDNSVGLHDVWLWDFGDGDTSNLSSPVHTYDSRGTYDVSLKITDTETGGSDREFKKRFVVVGASVSNFTFSPDSGCAGLQVTFSPVTAGAVNSLLWDFGDGFTSTDSIAIHTFDSIGEFTISLSVFSDCDNGFTLIDSPGVVISSCPTVGFFADTLTGCKPLLVTFADSSSSGGLPITSRIWNFGDGTIVTDTNPTYTHTYDSAGNFTVTLTIATSGGTDSATTVDYISIIDNTAAGFRALSQTSSCFSPFQQFFVQFEDTSLGEITSRTWRVDKPGIPSVTSDSANPVFSFPDPGSYDITLKVDGACGIDSTTMVGFVVLSEPLTSGGFTISPLTGTIDSVFTFSDTSSIAGTTRTWNFGDNSSSIDSVATHTYSTTGTYIVSLLLFNDCGSLQIFDSVVVVP